jgi:DNA-binding response OmpR family regulator
MQLVTAERIDAAVLNMNLHGQMAFDVARLLRQEKVPFLWLAGYNRESFSNDLRDAPICKKPAAVAAVCDLLKSML